MVARQTIGEQILAEGLVVSGLLKNAALVGGIYTMGYNECLVLTNDLWKRQAGGVPQHCFLLATAITPGTAPEPDDEEVILLRVIGPAALPAEAELVHVRAEAMREMVITRGEEEAATSPAILDVLTRNEIQFSALKAKILGTFFDTEIRGRPLLTFGSDVETFYSSSRYKVYKPHGQSLANIASYPELTELELGHDPAHDNPTKRIRIGAVRYSSSTRRRKQGVGHEGDTAVPVSVNIADFVAMKTAVFGMTRLGKSNAMKTIATAVFQYAVETSQQIGQLLFDPAGEYANVNVQDQTALSQIGPEFVTVFRFGAPLDQPGIRPLSSNFFSDETIGVTWAIINSYLSARTDADYIRGFLAANVIGPETEAENRSEFSRAQRRRAALYASLLKADFPPPPGLRVSFLVNANVLREVNQKIALTGSTVQLQSDPRGRLTLGANELREFWDGLAEAHADAAVNLGDWVDTQLDAILAVYTASVGRGFRYLQPLRVYHSPARRDDYADEVLAELVAGKIVIIDLSLGSEAVLKFASERIVNHILQDAGRRFTEGLQPHSIQIYIEEAHRLFNRDRMNVPEEADPYVRLAKEASKYRIGLIYATQEVSSVDALILSNTSNWIVTHLNNKSEVRELSKYYDFEDFAELTLSAEDVGFARVKTRSGRYIIPTQIDLFDPSRIDAARAAGLASLAPQDGAQE
jgi:hypothetical protein